MNAERDELPIERLLRAFACTAQGEDSRDIKTGTAMLKRIEALFSGAWNQIQEHPQKPLDEWEHWPDLNMAIATYNQVAKKCNLPLILVGNLNPTQGAVGQGDPLKSMDTLAGRVNRVAGYLKAQIPLTEEALRYGKYRPERRTRY